MKQLSILLLLMALVAQLLGYKIAIFAPDISGSQLIWNKRVAEDLAQAGHDVTMIRWRVYRYKNVDVKIDPAVKQWNWDAYVDIDYEELQKNHSIIAFADKPMWDRELLALSNKFLQVLIDGCENTLQNKEMLRKLVDAKFDLAFSHMYEYCSIGLIHYAKIPTWIWLSSGTLIDIQAHDMGVSSPPSYVPPLMADSSDKMTLVQRMKSVVGHVLGPLLYPSKTCPLVMVNTNELYDLPRPTLDKIINIGGLGMKMESAKNLSGEFSEIVNRAKGAILFTFGSVANASGMPYDWKLAFMNAFRKFPEYEFIMRYSTADLDEIKPKNVHFHKWIPQADLMQHPKTKALISHGGYNSLQETIYAARPIITIPLFGDQPRNGRIAEKHGFGYYLHKSNITEESIMDALNAVIHDERYTSSVQVINRMVNKKPIKPELLLIKWTEFLAEFRQLPNLEPYGVHLSFVQYNNLDVFAIFASVILVALAILYLALKLVFKNLLRVYRMFVSSEKVKKQ